MLERLVVNVCSETYEQLFKILCDRLMPELRTAIDNLLVVQSGEQRSLFYLLKEYPPSTTISSIQSYLERYRTLEGTGISKLEAQCVDPAFIDYLYKLACRYNARDIKRFKEPKRYAMMACFLLETRKGLLDHLIKMHDQFIMYMLRKAKHIHEMKHPEFCKRQKKAIDTLLDTTQLIIDWPGDKPLQLLILSQTKYFPWLFLWVIVNSKHLCLKTWFMSVYLKDIKSHPWLFGTGIHASTAQSLYCLIKLDTSRKLAIPAHPAIPGSGFPGLTYTLSSII